MRTKLDRINSKNKELNKHRKQHNYIMWYSDGRFHTPGKIKEKQDKKLDEAYDRDKENKIASWSHGSEFMTLYSKFQDEKIKTGYFVPKHDSYKSYKKISRRILRNISKRELMKDPDEISNKKGSSEDKEFDYWWAIG